MKLAKFVGIGAVALVAGLASVSVAMSGREAPALAALPLADGAYKLDPVHSTVVFRIRHNSVSYFYGRFNAISGSFSLDPDAAKNAVEVSIDASSVDTGNAKRDGHLKSPDFFSAGEFSTITFKSKTWKATTKEGADQLYDVVGDLTLLGKTKEVTAAIRHTGGKKGEQGELAGLEAKFTIKRSEFGMTKYIDNGALGDDVTIMVGLEGGRK